MEHLPILPLVVFGTTMKSPGKSLEIDFLADGAIFIISKKGIKMKGKRPYETALSSCNTDSFVLVLVNNQNQNCCNFTFFVDLLPVYLAFARRPFSKVVM